MLKCQLDASIGKIMKKLNVIVNDEILKMLPDHANLTAIDLGEIFNVKGSTILERVTRERFPKWDTQTTGTLTKAGKKLWKVSTIKKFIETLE